MALGDITALSPQVKAIELLASATATNSPPSGASAGLAMEVVRSAFGFIPPTLSLVVASTAGSGTMTVTLRLWGYFATIGSGIWVPCGPGADATKGTINEGSALGETGTDVIRHAEPIDLPSHFTRLYLEITAIGGTATAITSWLVGSYPEIA